MTDITTMDQLPTKRPRGRPKIFTEEEQKEKVKIISQRYYQNNSEQKKESVRLYYIENIDAIRERKRLYYLRKKQKNKIQ